jgi:DNA helicase IV
MPSQEDLAAELRRHPDVKAALERMWPRLTPMQLLHDLYGASALVDLAARRWLSDDERRLLHRRRRDDVARVSWTLADMPLLDEAAARLGSIRSRRDDDGSARTYGHIVVDEAQDLTAMQLRVLARRSLSGSMTLVGDVAQATGPTAPDDWKEVLEHLPAKRPPTIAQLTVNYRTPMELMDYASRVLAVAQPGARPPESVRSTGVPPSVAAAAPGTLAAAVADVVRIERAAVGDGMVAVIHPPSIAAELVAALSAAGITAGDPDHDGLDAPVTLVPVDLVKGLEFDAAVVVEPAAVVEESGQGLRALYVALTRATKRLAVVHEQPLPRALVDRR